MDAMEGERRDGAVGAMDECERILTLQHRDGNRVHVDAHRAGGSGAHYLLVRVWTPNPDAPPRDPTFDPPEVLELIAALAAWLHRLRRPARRRSRDLCGRAA